MKQVSVPDWEYRFNDDAYVHRWTGARVTNIEIHENCRNADEAYHYLMRKAHAMAMTRDNDYLRQSAMQEAQMAQHQALANMPYGPYQNALQQGIAPPVDKVAKKMTPEINPVLLLLDQPGEA